MPEMKKISVEELKPGMTFNKPLYVDSSNMLIGANAPLKESDIKKLMTWGVAAVETAGVMIRLDESTSIELSSSESAEKIVTEYDDLLKKRKSLISIHNSTRETVKNVYNSIRDDEPFEMEEMVKAVNSIIDLLRVNNNVFLFLYGLDEGKDYTITHAVNSTFYALIIGIALKYDNKKLVELGLGTLLMDSGMLKIPVYIVHKQSNLTDQEFNQIKTHTLHGYKSLRDLGKINENIASVTLQHHEHYDGKGYPKRFKGNEIHEYARIASIADSYEAQISNRSYKKKLDFYHAMRNLLASGVNRFDPIILRVFLSRMAVYPIGSLVKLNDSSIGVVIGSIPKKPLRPIIKLVFDKEGNKLEDTVILNLLDDTSVFIEKAMDESEVGINIFDVL